MQIHGFLSCPTCRTPRQGVTQNQVESANHQRVHRQSDDHDMMVQAQNRNFHVLFFPDQSEHPLFALSGNTRRTLPRRFSLHGRTTSHQRNEVDEAAEAAEAVQAVQAVQAVEAAATQAAEAAALADGPLHNATTSFIQLHGSIRDLVNGLLHPSSITEFLAVRETVRRHG